MTTRTSEPVPPQLCHQGGPQANGTACAEQLGLFPPLSSTLALLVLVAVLLGIVVLSLATFHFHKRRLRNRKMRRAQEEFERDSRSPTARARGGGQPARPCVIIRAPARCEEKPRQPEESGEVAVPDGERHAELSS